MPQAICLGELLIDFVSTTVDTGIAGSAAFAKAPGGAPANVAVGLARLGIDTGFIGKVGDEPFGAFLRDVVAQAGVDVSQLVIGEGARTTLAFVATRSNETKDIAFYRNPGADALLSPDELDWKYLESCRLFHFGSVSLSESPCRETTLEAARRAKAAGALVSYDPNWRPALWRDHTAARDLIWEAMSLADLAKLADEEWEFVTGTTELNAGAEKILSHGPQWVVVTRGEAGCWFTNGSVSGEVDGFEVEVVDPLGAGDGFVAALLSKLIGYDSIADVTLEELTAYATFANAAGALTTQQVGVIPALPDLAAVQTFLSPNA